MPTPPPSPWYASFAVPHLPPTPNLSLYVFQDKALEHQVYSSQMQWLSGTPTPTPTPTPNPTPAPAPDPGADETRRKQNEVLRWLGECVLRGLTGVLLMMMFPELEARSLEVTEKKEKISVCTKPHPTGLEKKKRKER